MNLSPRTTWIGAPAIAAAASALAYPRLPQRVATHFGATNRPDRFSARTMAVLRAPALMAAIAIANDRFGGWPGARDREDVGSGARARGEAIGLFELALLFNHLAILANGLGVPLDMPRVQRAVYSVLIIGMGNVMPKLPRNGLVGIRTPWTLADPVVWERTHRLAGYLCTLAGLIGLMSLPASGKRADRIPRLALLGAAAVSVAYSGIVFARRSR
jgi:uncharacterized membrane protein